MAGFFSNLFFGKPSKIEQRSLLSPQQQLLQNQLMGAAQGQGAGGAFGQAADYYRNLLSDDSADFNAFSAPEMRRFREEIVPGLAEQFAGLGAGSSGLSGSNFRNAAVNAGADLSERLGSIRAQLRQNAAQGLQNIGGAALNPYMQNIFRPQQPGLAGQALGTALGSFISPGLGALGGQWANMMFNPATKASPIQAGKGNR